MTEDEFNKAPKLDQILYDCTGMLVKNHHDIAEAMQKYADQQLLIQGDAISLARAEKYGRHQHHLGTQQKALKPFKYDKLNLFKLDELRGEVGRRLNQINKQ